MNKLLLTLALMLSITFGFAQTNFHVNNETGDDLEVTIRYLPGTCTGGEFVETETQFVADGTTFIFTIPLGYQVTVVSVYQPVPLRYGRFFNTCFPVCGTDITDFYDGTYGCGGDLGIALF